MNGLEFNGIADLTQIIAAIQQFTAVNIKLIDSQISVQGQLQKVTNTVDAEGNAIRRVTVQENDGITSTYKLDGAYQVLGRTSTDITAKLERQRQVMLALNAIPPPQQIRSQIQAFNISGVVPTGSTGKEFAGFKTNETVVGIENIKRATDDATKSSQSFLMSWQSMGRLLTIQLMHQAISQLSQAIKQGTQSAIEYQLRISEIRTISQETGITFVDWATGIREVSDSFGLPILETAEAAYQAISNQVTKGAETFKFMTEAAKLAVTTVATIDESVNTLSSVMNAYGKTTKDTADISAKLFVAVNLGRFRLEDMANSLGNITIIGREAGISFEELLAAMAAMTRQGMTWSNSMTQLRGLILQFLKPSVDMGKFLKEIGVASGEAAFKTYGFLGAIDLLRQKTDGSSTAIAEEIRNVRGLLGVLTLIGQGHDAYIEALGRVSNATEEYAKATEIAMESNARKIKIETEKLKNYFIKDIGDSVLSSMVKVSASMGGFVNVVQNTMTTIKIAVEVGAFALISQFGRIIRGVEGLIASFIALRTASIASFGWIGIVAGLVAYIVQLELATNHMDKLAAAEAAIFKQFQENIAARKVIMAEQNRVESEGIKTLFQEASAELAGRVAVKIAEMNDTITATIENSKVVAKIIDEAIGGVISNLREDLSEVKSTIRGYESIVTSAGKFSGDLDKKIDQIKEKFSLEQALGDPTKQVQLLGNSLKGLVKELAQSSSIIDFKERFDQVKRLTDQITDNIVQQSRITIDVEKTNIKNIKERKNIEESMRKEELSYGEKFRNMTNKIETLEKKKSKEGNKEKLNEAIRDRQFLVDEHKRKQDAYKKDLEEHKNVELKKFEFEKMLEKAKLAALKQTQAIRDVLTGAKGRTGKITELESEQTSIEDRIKLLQNIKQELDRLDLSKIFAQKDPKLIAKWFEDRADMIQNAIKIMTAELPKLPDLEKKKIEEVINQLSAERAAIKLKIEIEPKLKEDATAAQNALQLADEKLKFLTVDLGKLREGIAAIQGIIIQGLDYTVADIKSKTVKGPAGEVLSTSPIIQKYGKGMLDILEQVRKGFLADPGLLKKLPEDVLKAVTDAAGITDKSVQLLIDQVAKLQATSKAMDDQRIAALALVQRLKGVDEAMAKTTETIIPLSVKFTNFGNAAFTLSESLVTLSKKIDAIIIPTMPAPVASAVPPKQFLSEAGFPMTRALGGFMQGSDSIPALLSPGEFVMNAASTRRFYGQLVAMNSIGRFADGGKVGNNVNVGDVNISVRSSGNESVDVIKMGRLLQREIKRGTISLS